jgi:hypothetical protein
MQWILGSLYGQSTTEKNKLILYVNASLAIEEIGFVISEAN